MSIIGINDNIRIDDSHHMVTVGEILALSGADALRGGTIVGATSIELWNISPGRTANSGWVVIDPYTTECEIRKVTGINGATCTVAALAYAHALGDGVVWVDQPVYIPAWFGAKGDGSTDDTVALQAMFDAAGSNAQIELAGGECYLISDTINWKTKNFQNFFGNSAIIRTKTGTNFANKAMLNLSGNGYLSMQGLYLDASVTSNYPAAGLVLGRTGFSGGANTILHCLVTGYFSHSAVYNVGSELTKFIGCNFNNYATDGICCVYSSNVDALNLVDVDGGQRTAYWYGCTVHVFGTAGDNFLFRGQVMDHTIRDCYGYMADGRAFVRLATHTGDSYMYNCVFNGIRTEGAEGSNAATRFLVVDGANGWQYCTLANINHGGVTGSDYLMEVAAGAVLIGGLIDGNSCTYPSGKRLLKVGAGALVRKIQINSNYQDTLYFDAAAIVDKMVIQTVDSEGTPPFQAGGLTNLLGFVAGPPKQTQETFAANDASPDVSGGHFFKTANSSPTEILTFDNGYLGQEIIIEINDANTSLGIYPATGTARLRGNNGADYTCNSGDAVRAVWAGYWWYVTIIDIG